MLQFSKTDLIKLKWVSQDIGYNNIMNKGAQILAKMDMPFLTEL